MQYTMEYICHIYCRKPWFNAKQWFTAINVINVCVTKYKYHKTLVYGVNPWFSAQPGFCKNLAACFGFLKQDKKVNKKVKNKYS